MTCFLNEGNGHFTNITSSSGAHRRIWRHVHDVGRYRWGRDLDLYVATYAKLALLRSAGVHADKVCQWPTGGYRTGRGAIRVVMANSSSWGNQISST